MDEPLVDPTTSSSADSWAVPRSVASALAGVALLAALVATPAWILSAVPSDSSWAMRLPALQLGPPPAPRPAHAAPSADAGQRSAYAAPAPPRAPRGGGGDRSRPAGSPPGDVQGAAPPAGAPPAPAAAGAPAVPVDLVAEVLTPPGTAAAPGDLLAPLVPPVSPSPSPSAEEEDDDDEGDADDEDGVSEDPTAEEPGSHDDDHHHWRPGPGPDELLSGLLGRGTIRR